MINTQLWSILFIIILSLACYYTLTRNIIPFIAKRGMKELEKNPKWIISNIHKNYYGFYDIDFILTESKYGGLPYFRFEKKTRHLEVLIPNDTSTNDINDIAKLALSAKIKIFYGLDFRDKPLHWLSILCYMLDGGEIKQEATKWEKVEK